MDPNSVCSERLRLNSDLKLKMSMFKMFLINNFLHTFVPGIRDLGTKARSGSREFEIEFHEIVTDRPTKRSTDDGHKAHRDSNKS